MGDEINRFPYWEQGINSIRGNEVENEMGK
jgi:hypothetical protein